jgi:hypothetical protein
MLDPETCKILQDAHDAACRSLMGTGVRRLGTGPRNALAMRILRCAEKGERDPQKLVAYALAANASLVFAA